MTTEYDDPLTVELETDREAMVLMFCLGAGAQMLMLEEKLQGAQVCSNLQIRLCSEYPKQMAEASEEFSEGGVAADTEGSVAVSGPAGVARMADAEEQDPDRVNDGKL